MLINGIAGKIDTADLGLTLMHEHVVNLYSDMRRAFADWFDEEALLSGFAEQIQEAKGHGVKTVVDGTPINLGRDINLMKKAADRAEVNMLVSTGFYNMEGPWLSARGVVSKPEIIAGFLLREINNGIQGTDIKPAQIKCATDASTGITDVNRQILRGCALAHKESGLPIYTHTTPKDLYMGIYQQELLCGECGVAPHQVVIGHSFDSQNVEYIEKLIQNGTYVGCDRVGLDIVNPLENIVNCLVPLLEKGYASQIMLSHDSCVVNDCAFSFNNVLRTADNPTLLGYSVIFTRLIPALKERGIPQEDIDMMMIENPRRFYEGKPIPKKN